MAHYSTRRFRRLSTHCALVPERSRRGIFVELQSLRGAMAKEGKWTNATPNEPNAEPAEKPAESSSSKWGEVETGEYQRRVKKAESGLTMDERQR